MTPMAKMAVAICVLALGIYGSWFVKLGDRTFREHIARIAKTPEVHDLGSGIVSAVDSAKSKVKSKIAARLHASRSERADQQDDSDTR